MPLAAGTRLGPYEILVPLGAGGMGEVYRARDTRLGRDVAIKVSHENFTERFEQEARSIAALNHPHICHLYDVGPNYLVMELIEGERLKGPLPIEKAIEYGGQILDALDAAHQKGITHRDLKPSNILVTKQGIKLLDFGLARAAPGGDSTVTMAREVAGTPAYMAPEQWEGKPADARCDIYAFGCVLHELLTGKRVAHDRSRVEPAALESVVATCLERDPEDRWQSARDIKRALLLVQIARRSNTPPAEWGSKLRWALAGALVIALVAGGIGWYNATRPASLRPLIRLNAEIAPDTPLARGDSSGAMLDLSPDGTRLAVTMRGADGTVRLYTRLLNQSQVTPLAGTDKASYPFFSPDGEWIGFFADAQLKKIPVQGGTVVTLCDAPVAGGASWGDDGNIIADIDRPFVLSRIPSAGGTPVPVTKLKSAREFHLWPQVLPGSQAVVFTPSPVGGSDDDADIDVISLKTGERRTVVRGGYSARYVAHPMARKGTATSSTCAIARCSQCPSTRAA